MRRWQLPISYLAHSRQPSWLGRHFLAACHVVILIASWYPFSGWRYTGEGLFAFYAYPLPYYQTAFDNAINIVAYLPLGYAWALAFRCRWHSPLWACVFGALLSALVEFVQQFLPDRVASNLDILCNTFGALAGAMAAILLDKLLITRHWHVLRQRWFAKGALADYGLTLLALWLVTQLNPAVPLFGIVFAPQGIPQAFISPIANARLFLQLLEACGVMLNITAIGLMIATVLARRSHAAPAIVVLGISMIALKALFAWLMLKSDAFLAWINWNVVGGALAAWGLLAVLGPLKRRWRSVAALLCLALAGWVESAWPLNDEPVALLGLFKWHYGHLRDFGGLTQTISTLWPWLAAVYLLCLSWRDWRRNAGLVVIE
jgi:VanZ family protein